MAAAASRPDPAAAVRTAGAGTDQVFRALADPSRRRLLDSLNATNGQNLGQLSGGCT